MLKLFIFTISMLCITYCFAQSSSLLTFSPPSPINVIAGDLDLSIKAVGSPRPGAYSSTGANVGTTGGSFSSIHPTRGIFVFSGFTEAGSADLTITYTPIGSPPISLPYHIIVSALESTFQNFDDSGSPYVSNPDEYYFPGHPPGPTVLSEGPSGNFLRLVNRDPLNASINSIAFSKISGFPSIIRAEFDLRITHGDLNNAGGMSFALLNTNTYREDGTPFVADGYADLQEPDFYESIGVGFDTFRDAGELNDNHISIHYNLSKLAEFDAFPVVLGNGKFIHVQIIIRQGDFSDISVVLTPLEGESVRVVNQFVIPGLVPYEGRAFFGASSESASGADQDIDNIKVEGEALLRFTPESPAFFSIGDPPLSFTALGSPLGGFYFTDIKDVAGTGGTFSPIDIHTGVSSFSGATFPGKASVAVQYRAFPFRTVTSVYEIEVYGTPPAPSVTFSPISPFSVALGDPSLNIVASGSPALGTFSSTNFLEGGTGGSFSAIDTDTGSFIFSRFTSAGTATIDITYTPSLGVPITLPYSVIVSAPLPLLTFSVPSDESFIIGSHDLNIMAIGTPSGGRFSSTPSTNTTGGIFSSIGKISGLFTFSDASTRGRATIDITYTLAGVSVTVPYTLIVSAPQR